MGGNLQVEGVPEGFRPSLDRGASFYSPRPAPPGALVRGIWDADLQDYCVLERHP